MNELTRKCLMLPDGDKIRLMNTLRCSVEDKAETTRFDVLYKAACEVMGCDILKPIKLREMVLGRSMVAYQLRLEGYTLHDVGRYLVKHNSTVLSMQRQVEDAIQYPHIYSKEIRLWKLFQEKVKEYEMQN